MIDGRDLQQGLAVGEQLFAFLASQLLHLTEPFWAWYFYWSCMAQAWA